MQFSADTLWSLQPGFPHLAPSHPVPWRATLCGAAGEQRTRRPCCAPDPGALAAPGAGMVLTAASLLLSRAVRPASTALPFLAGAGTGGGDQRPRQRASELWPVPPPARRADPHRSRRRVHPEGVRCPLRGLSQASGLVRGGPAEATARSSLARLLRGRALARRGPAEPC